MSTDKTLADVQPGGRVRLGDQDAQTIEKLRAMMDHSFGGPGFVVYGTSQSIAEIERRLAPSLAARQPVGEPVVYGLRVKGTSAIVGVLPVELKDFPVKNSAWDERYDEVPLYAAPPAQAVDLGQLRALADRWATDRSYSGSPADDLRAWIDSQAVGE